MNNPLSSSTSLNTVADALVAGATLCDQALDMRIGECQLRLRSNSSALLAQLGRYFSHVASPSTARDIDIVAIERESPELGVEFVDWQREPGKTGRKDSYVDLPNGRLIRKVRTGMVFLQSGTQRIAAGACLRHDNQVINFINAQYMTWLQQRGWLICHAAGLVRNGLALGIAGFSGGGKSTLMLHAMESPETAYLTNDRLFINAEGATVRAAGIPKLPRVNPGTIVHNRRLQQLIPASRRAELLAMPQEELWELEEKYDVLIDQVYGQDRIVAEAPLGAFVVLNWQRHSDQPMQLQRVDLAARHDLLGAIMKSPGPFYQYADGAFFDADTRFDVSAYLDALNDIPVYEASGRIDFDVMTERLNELLD